MTLIIVISVFVSLPCKTICLYKVWFKDDVKSDAFCQDMKSVWKGLMQVKLVFCVVYDRILLV